MIEIFKGLTQVQLQFFMDNPGKLAAALHKVPEYRGFMSVYVNGQLYETWANGADEDFISDYIYEQDEHGVADVVILDRFGKIIAKNPLAVFDPAKIEVWAVARDTYKGFYLRMGTKQQKLFEQLQECYENEEGESPVIIQDLDELDEYQLSESVYNLEWETIEIK